MCSKPIPVRPDSFLTLSDVSSVDETTTAILSEESTKDSNESWDMVHPSPLQSQLCRVSCPSLLASEPVLMAVPQRRFPLECIPRDIGKAEVEFPSSLRLLYRSKPLALAGSFIYVGANSVGNLNTKMGSSHSFEYRSADLLRM